MSEQNKATVRRMVEEVQNRHQIERIEEFFDPNFINHLEDPERLSEFNAVHRAKIVFGQLFAAFPDLHVTIQNQLAEGDKVVTHRTAFRRKLRRLSGRRGDSSAPHGWVPHWSHSRRDIWLPLALNVDLWYSCST